MWLTDAKLIIMAVMMILFSKIVSCNALVFGFGEICNNSDECSDHRYNCLPDEDNVYRCTCDRFHAWKGRKIGCFQIYNATTILNMTITSSDHKANISERLEKQMNKMFKIQAAAGIFVFGTIFISAAIVIGYCLHMFQSDRKLKHSVRAIRNRVLDGSRDRERQRGIFTFQTSLV